MLIKLKILIYGGIMKTGSFPPYVGVYMDGAKGNIKHPALGFTTTTAVNSYLNFVYAELN
jgi:hypothetical protein